MLEAQLQDGGLTEESRRELDELRKERDRLESQVQELEVRDFSSDISLPWKTIIIDLNVL